MGAVRPAARMRPVELVDEDDDRPEPGGPSARGHATPAGRGRSGDGASAGDASDDDAPDDDGRTAPRRWPWVIGLLVVALAAGTLANGVTERSARASADAFGRLPGLVRPVETPPVALWRAPADGPTPLLAAAGAVVTVTGAQGRWVVRSTGTDTGAARWEVPLVDASGPGFESVAVACSAGTSPTSPVVCRWAEPGVVYGGSGESTPYVPPTQVVALDPATGARTGQWEVGRQVLDVVRQADDLVVATGLRDRRVQVERHDATTGAVRWSWTSSTPLVDTGGVRAAPRLRDGGVVVSLVATSTTVFDVATGDVLQDAPPGRQVLVAAVPGAGYATWESGAGGALHDADGSVRAPVAALPVTVVGDGSVGPLLVDAGNRVLAVEALDGSVAWALPTSMAPVAVAHGVVVMAGDASVGAVDARDGRLLWEHDVLVEQLVAPLTDGLHVLTVEPDAAQGPALVARGLRDGVEAWRVGLPTDVVGLAAVAGRVVVRTPTEVVVLG